MTYNLTYTPESFRNRVEEGFFNRPKMILSVSGPSAEADVRWLCENHPDKVAHNIECTQQETSDGLTHVKYYTGHRPGADEDPEHTPDWWEQFRLSNVGTDGAIGPDCGPCSKPDELCILPSRRESV